MSEVENRPASKPAKSKLRKLFDISIIIVFAVIFVLLAKNLVNQLSLKNEVRAATVVTDQVVSAIRKQDGKAARNLGDKTFQSQNTAANLTAQFKVASKFTASTPVVSRRTVTNASGTQAVSVIYKFSKPTFYIRTIVVKTDDSGKFQLANLKADPSDKPLLDNKY